MPTPTTTYDGSLTGDEVIRLIRRLCSQQCYLSLVEAASLLRTTRRQILRWIHDGNLRAYAPQPGKWIVSSRELDNFVKIHQIQIPTDKRA